MKGGQCFFLNLFLSLGEICLRIRKKLILKKEGARSWLRCQLWEKDGDQETSV